MKRRKCDRCEKPATIHLTEIDGKAKVEKHLCEDCAAAEGITFKATMPIAELLQDIAQHAAGGPPEESPALTWE